MRCTNDGRSIARSLLAIALVALSASTAAAQPFLFGATGAGGTAGSLYILNQQDGSIVQTIGTLEDAGGNDFAITGLAWNPATSTLYGSTATISPTAPRSLVTINPFTARVTTVAPYTIPGGGTLSDISFQPGTNVLYGWSPVNAALFTVNLTTGVATQIGPSTAGLQGGGALAFRSDGVLFAAPDEANQRTLYTVNPTTGVLTSVGSRPVDLFFLNAFAFNGPTLYGSLSLIPPNVSNLGTVDTSTGTTTALGPAVLNLDAIEFLPIPEPSSLLLVGVAAAGLARLRKRRAKSPVAT